MRPAHGLVLILLLSACGSMTPGDPQLMGANEMQQRPGLFSGADGAFVVARRDLAAIPVATMDGTPAR